MSKLNTALFVAALGLSTTGCNSTVENLNLETKKSINNILTNDENTGCRACLQQSIDLVGYEDVIEFWKVNEVIDAQDFVEKVKGFQCGYNENTTNPIEVDGIYGPETRDIFKSLQ